MDLNSNNQAGVVKFKFKGDLDGMKAQFEKFKKIKDINHIGHISNLYEKEKDKKIIESLEFALELPKGDSVEENRIDYRIFDKKTNKFYFDVYIFPVIKNKVKIREDFIVYDDSIEKPIIINGKDVEINVFTGLKYRNKQKIYTGDIIKNIFQNTDTVSIVDGIISVFGMPIKDILLPKDIIVGNIYGI